MKTSITKKLLFLFLSTIFVTFFTCFVIYLLYFRGFYQRYTEHRLLSVIAEVELAIKEEDIEQAIAELDFRQQVSIIVTDKDFENPIFSHNLSAGMKENLSNELQQLVENHPEQLEKSHIRQQLHEINPENKQKLERMVLIKELSNGFYCCLSNPLETLDSSMSAMTQFLIVAGIVACSFGTLVTLLFSKGFTKPILAINQATEKMSQLDFQHKIEHNSHDELGQLANNINVLSNSLENYKSALEKEIEFQKILSLNMSHELKTPISVIQGYNQGISNGMAAKKGKVEKYHAVIFQECEQMTQLIDQMLELSKLSSTLEDSFEKKVFSALDFTEKLKIQHQSLLLQHEIELVMDVSSVELWGNMDLLLQCFGNFMTNAVKYGDGKEIRVQIEEVDDYSVMSVYNTGKHIPEAELEQIFGVFYMIDKARSRKLHSHGLGLSVSKTIAELHKGSVSCENSVGGVTVVLEIPRIQV